MKLDYRKLNWDAVTNWGFAGCYKNLREIRGQYYKINGVEVSIEEFGYQTPDHRTAFAFGDVVVHKGRFATVLERSFWLNRQLTVRMSDGEKVTVRMCEIRDVKPADIPAELLALARVEAGKTPVDVSRCPLKHPYCTEAGE